MDSNQGRSGNATPTPEGRSTGLGNTVAVEAGGMSRPIPRYTLDVARQSELMQLLDEDGTRQRAQP